MTIRFVIRTSSLSLCIFFEAGVSKVIAFVNKQVPLRSAFLLFDAAIFCLEALKQKILYCPENIFSSVKLTTLYPGYILKGEVYHSMRGFKEEQRSVLVSVTLMKEGITASKELRKNPE